jgi:ubiquinone/menaquinone biosynthesis C-methylase UbiE
MNEHMDIELLVDTLRSERYEWNKLIDAVGEARMQLPGVVGGWSVKDMIAHISWAERETLFILSNRMSDGSALWYVSQDERNEIVYQQNRERPLEEVLTEANDVFEELITIIEGLKEEAIHDASYFQDMPAEWVPWQVIAANTYFHYRAHAPELRVWLDAQNDYEYRGLIAKSWDLLRGNTSQWSDRYFFWGVIVESGTPALDVGCGTGRLLLDYLSDGLDVEGVDVSPEMLNLLLEKAREVGINPQVYLQAMESLDLPHKYRTIIVPSSSFQLVTDLAQAGGVMERFYAHLEPGGKLAMSFMLAYEGEAQESGTRTTDWELAGEEVRPANGASVRRWTRSTIDFDQKLEHTEDRYEILKEGQVVEVEEYRRSPATRWYTQEESAELFYRTGFEEVQLYHEFSQKPVGPDSRVWVVTGKRPSEGV